MKWFLVLCAVSALAAGCATTEVPDPCGEPIKVPAPYWDPPNTGPPLDPTPRLYTPTFTCPPDVTVQRCAELELEAMTADFLLLLADDDQCRFRYDGLVDLVESVPPVTPPPSGVTPPPD